MPPCPSPATLSDYLGPALTPLAEAVWAVTGVPLLLLYQLVVVGLMGHTLARAEGELAAALGAVVVATVVGVSILCAVAAAGLFVVGCVVVFAIARLRRTSREAP